MHLLLLSLIFFHAIPHGDAFTLPVARTLSPLSKNIIHEDSLFDSSRRRAKKNTNTQLQLSFSFSNPLEELTKNLFPKNNNKAILPTIKARKVGRARELVKSLINEENCFTTEAGAQAFADVCAINVVYEDRFEPQPIVGKEEVRKHMLQKVAQRKGKGGFRLDKVSDGDVACGFAWTWTCGNEEGLRGTTFVELNPTTGEIQYVQEIPEPIFKPGDATKQLLEAVTKGAERKPPQSFVKKTPTAANEVAKYLFLEIQDAKDETGMNEMISFFDDSVIYRDFNFENVLRGPAEVRQFVDDFNFPGITFRPLRFDDGVDSTCFTWEVVLEGVDDTIKGMSFYELDATTRKIVYVRDVPESAIKPPILGKLARQLRPGLGVFQGVPLGSRPGGM